MPSRSNRSPADAPLVWYVAYGSNLAEQRFACYLRGGRPSGAVRVYTGCRDTSAARRSTALEIPGGLVFAGRSTAWGGGGIAFYDPAAAGRVACRGYLITREQFADVAAQEMRRPPGGAFARALAEALPEVGAVRVMGPGHYETVTRLGERAGAPLVTITAAAPERPPLAAPTAAYLRWVAAGLREAHRWSAPQIAAYLAAVPGARGVWTTDQVVDLVRQGAPRA